MAVVASAGSVVADSAAALLAEPTPLYEALLGWTQARLAGHGYARPFVKRLALLVAGLLAGGGATVAGLAEALVPLAVTPAQEPSIARRLARLLEDRRLEPRRVLPDLLPGVLAALLAGQGQAHAANRGLSAAQHARFRPIHLVLDETSVDDRLHVAVVGLVVAGVTLPLGLRCWPQNASLPDGTYWAELGGLLAEVQAVLPAELREHVLLLADRAYGVPRFLDLCRALGWAYLVRVQGQAVVCLPDGTERAARDLAPRPGGAWASGAALAPADAPSGEEPAAGAPLRIFKRAGWRWSHVVADWAPGEAAPWLLLTDLPGTTERARQYARRWAIERTFLSWKSHGWDIERCGLRTAGPLGRLLSGLAVATLWRLVGGLPLARQHLRPPRGRRPTGQLRLPLGDPPRSRPWAAKFSLLTWGAKAFGRVPLRTHTPPLCWHLPTWDPTCTWADLCRQRAFVPV
jgi:hypothetical protein